MQWWACSNPGAVVIWSRLATPSTFWAEKLKSINTTRRNRTTSSSKYFRKHRGWPIGPVSLSCIIISKEPMWQILVGVAWYEWVRWRLPKCFGNISRSRLKIRWPKSSIYLMIVTNHSRFPFITLAKLRGKSMGFCRAIGTIPPKYHSSSPL